MTNDEKKCKHALLCTNAYLEPRTDFLAEQGTLKRHHKNTIQEQWRETVPDIHLRASVNHLGAGYIHLVAR